MCMTPATKEETNKIIISLFGRVKCPSPSYQWGASFPISGLWSWIITQSKFRKFWRNIISTWGFANNRVAPEIFEKDFHCPKLNGKMLVWLWLSASQDSLTTFINKWPVVIRIPKHPSILKIKLMIKVRLQENHDRAILDFSIHTCAQADRKENRAVGNLLTVTKM